MARTTKKTPVSVESEPQISVTQFQAWLSGVEDMQGDDWHPTKEQWTKIRAKIGMLIEFAGTTYAGEQSGQGERSGGISRQEPKRVGYDESAAERAIMANFGASLAAAPGPLAGVQPGVQPSSLAAVPPAGPPGRPTGRSSAAGKTIQVAGKTVHVEGTVKTPDVGEGPYKSQFL